jgi:putative transposase
MSYGQNKPIEDVIRENILSRAFDQDVMDAVWVTDITYIPCIDGRLYLATRIPRTFKVAANMRKHLVINPLLIYSGEMPDTIHSDRGSQYRSYDYRDLLKENNIVHCMSEPGTPVNNRVTRVVP